jgi:diguanylate cyclase (GGDEF)-like protein
MEENRILVAESKAEDRVRMETRLQARGYSVKTVRTSEEAIKEIENEPYDLMLLDAEMELIDGKELAERVREISFRHYVPVIMTVPGENLARLITSVPQGIDDFLIKPFDALTLELRVSMNIKRGEERMHANPLTRLPGNVVIENRLRDKIERGEIFSVCYVDINDFKSFNDLYGYDRGDDAIRHTARLLVDNVRKLGDAKSFIGHLGGDDFIVILDPELEEEFARALIEDFDRLMPTYYSEEDQKRGHVLVRNRRGKMERFPLMSVCIATVANLYRKFSNPREVAQVAAEVKKFLKTQPGSNYLRDRREKQIEYIDEAIAILESPRKEPRSYFEEKPLGQVLIDAGLIRESDLQDALKQHFQTGQRLGEVLLSMKLVEADQIGRILERKLGVPYVSLEQTQPSKEFSFLLNPEFLTAHEVIPLGFDKEKLILGMADPLDTKTLEKITSMTGYAIAPRLVFRKELETFYQSRL